MRNRLLLLASLALVGCATSETFRFQPAGGAPSGSGEVKVKPAGVNTAIEVEAKSLAGEPGSTYVAWVKPLYATAPPQNVGALTLSGRGKGRLQAMTPYRSFELFVTTERSADASAPSGARLLSTRVEEKMQPKG